MRWNRAGYVLAAMLLLAPSGARAQAGFLDNPQLRQMMEKFWNPVVGAGEAYQSLGGSNQERSMQLALIGTESVKGDKAYWVEITLDLPEVGGTVYAKDLIVPGEARPRRVIVQLPGEAPMEMPFNGTPGKPKVKDRHLHKVGNETVTVPAGTFACEHWQDDDTDVWINAKLAPVTMVKSVNRHDKGTDVLVKTIQGAKDHITGAIKPWDPAVFMRHMKGPGDR